MSASCDFTLKFHGSDEDFEKFVDKLYEIEGKSRHEKCLFHPFDINNHTITAHNGFCHNIWGDFYLMPDVDMYLDLAKVVPNSAFEVESYRINEVGGGGCETFLNVSYENRKLIFRSQKCVDSFSFMFLLGDMYSDFYCEENTFAIAGRSKLFDSVDGLIDYVESLDGTVSNVVATNTNYLICNNPNLKHIKVEKAKELGIPIISEAKFVRMFGDVFDFEDNCELILADLTYEEFCEWFTIDETITREKFEELRTNPHDEGIIVSNDNEVSVDGPWDETVYVLNDDGEFVEKCV